MAEVKHRCRLYFQFPAQPSAKLEAQLAQAIATTDAACVLLCGDGAPIDEDHAGRLIDLVQASGLACLIEQRRRPGRAARGRRRAYRRRSRGLCRGAQASRRERKHRRSAAASSRHDAMQLAELGADYVAFGPEAESIIDAIDQYADLIAWWSEIFVVPCVAWNVDTAEQAAKFAALGADFVAPSARIWQRRRRVASASPRSIMPSAMSGGLRDRISAARRGRGRSVGAWRSPPRPPAPRESPSYTAYFQGRYLTALKLAEQEAAQGLEGGLHADGRDLCGRARRRPGFQQGGRRLCQGRRSRRRQCPVLARAAWSPKASA